MKPKEWWGNPNNANVWLAKERNRPIESKTASLDKVLDDFANDENKFKSILEVGAGNGRLIGVIHLKYPEKICCSLDINPELSKYVSDKYGITSYVGELANLGLEDNSFDLVYTYQVIQHCHPEEINRAMSEIKRVAKKEIWFYEGWIDFNLTRISNGALRHSADGGTFYWNIEKFFKPYCMWLHEEDNKIPYAGIMTYKIKI